ncbi:MAG TPA: site-specific integrase [Burkholderiaceae bacterium]|nr:site-specific integrase [Burkholderiaceae bacterium]
MDEKVLSSPRSVATTNPPGSAPRPGVGQREFHQRTGAAPGGRLRPVITDDPLPVLTLRQAAEAFMVWHTRTRSNGDLSTATRVQFWIDCLGDRPMNEIRRSHIGQCVKWLAERGAMRYQRRGADRRNGVLVPLNRPVSNATLNRHVAALGSIFKYAHQNHLLSPDVASPVRGIRKQQEQPRHERYLTEAEVDDMVKVARALDRRWGKMAALLVFGLHTGLRRSNIASLTWGDIDLDARTVVVGRDKTKNNEPIHGPLSRRVVEELRRLPGTRARDAKVFCGKVDAKAFDWDRLWDKVRAQCGLGDRNFHQLRHGAGSAMARKGLGQAQIMMLLNHRSLAASAKYMHLSLSDKQDALDRVFD